MGKHVQKASVVPIRAAGATEPGPLGKSFPFTDEQTEAQRIQMTEHRANWKQAGTEVQVTLTHQPMVIPFYHIRPPGRGTIGPQGPNACPEVAMICTCQTLRIC